MMVQFFTYVQTVLSDEDGATMVEYAFMVTLIAMAAFLAVTAFGLGVRSLFDLVVFP